MDGNLSTLLGTLGGGILGGGSAWLAERSRWKREQNKRWDADRRRTYAAFLTAAVIFSDAIHDWSKTTVEQPGSQETRDRQIAVEVAHRELMAPLFEMRLLSGLDLIRAAEALKEGLDQYWTKSRRLSDLAEWQAVLNWWSNTWDALRDEVINTAKRELDVILPAQVNLRQLRRVPNIRHYEQPEEPQG